MNSPNFDASSDPFDRSEETISSGSERRPFLGIRFECCRTYARIYRNESQDAYVGNCPECRARVTVPIGGGGSSSRFFSAG